MSKNYYKKSNDQSSEENQEDIKSSEKAGNFEDFEEFVPYYDKNNGEYKYVPASGKTGDENNNKFFKQDNYGNDSVTGELVGRINFLNAEIKKSNKKTEEDKINMLNEELTSLKEQFLEIKTQNEIKKEIDRFKKDFIAKQNLKENYQKPYDQGYNYENPYQQRHPQGNMQNYPHGYEYRQGYQQAGNYPQDNMQNYPHGYEYQHTGNYPQGNMQNYPHGYEYRHTGNYPQQSKGYEYENYERQENNPGERYSDLDGQIDFTTIAASKLATGEDIEKLVERVKKEIYQGKELDLNKIIKVIEKLNLSRITEQDIIDKVNLVVDDRLKTTCNQIIGSIILNLEQKFNEIKVQDNAMQSEALSKATYKEEENSKIIAALEQKIEQLKENIKLQLDENINKQNELLLKFSQTAEKLELNSTEASYAETMLEEITNIRADVHNFSKENTEIRDSFTSLKENINKINNEFENFKDSYLAAVKEDISLRFNELNPLIAKIEENLQKAAKNNIISAEEIKYNTSLEINNAVNSIEEKFDFSRIKENINTELAEIKKQLEDNSVLMQKSGESSQASVENLKNTLMQELNNAVGSLDKKFDFNTFKENIDLVYSNLKDEIVSVVLKINESGEELKGLKELISDDISDLKEELSGELAKITGEDTSKEEIKLLKEELLLKVSNINSVLSENFEKISQSNEAFLGVKGEIGEKITALGDNITLNIQKLKQDLNIGFLKFKDELLTDITSSIELIKDLPIAGIMDKVEDIGSRLNDITGTIAKNINSIDGLGISVDTLLRQAEENASSQSFISSNIESINTELSGFSSKFENIAQNEGSNLNVDFINVNDSIKKLADKAEEAAGISLNVIIAEISKKLDENLAKNAESLLIYSKKLDEDLAKNKEESANYVNKNAKINKSLADEITGLKNLIINNQNPDLSYDLSSIYSELKRLRNASETGKQSEIYENNYLSLNNDIDSIRKDLKDISLISDTEPAVKEKSKKK